MAQVKAEFEYRCRKCGQVFVNMDQILTDERDIAALRHLRGMLEDTVRGLNLLLAIHFCKPGEDRTLSPEVGIGDLIGYVIRSK